jgi:uncharacterized membrane protein
VICDRRPELRFLDDGGAASTFTNAMNDVQRAFEAAAVLVLVIGITTGFGLAARDLRHDRRDVYRSLRSFVGRTILLGLEILVAADLIRTVAVDTSIENVGVRALIGLIRPASSLVGAGERPVPSTSGSSPIRRLSSSPQHRPWRGTDPGSRDPARPDGNDELDRPQAFVSPLVGSELR